MKKTITNPRHLPSSDAKKPVEKQPPLAGTVALPGFTTIGQAAFRAVTTANNERKKKQGDDS